VFVCVFCVPDFKKNRKKKKKKKNNLFTLHPIPNQNPMQITPLLMRLY